MKCSLERSSRKGKSRETQHRIQKVQADLEENQPPKERTKAGGGKSLNVRRKRKKGWGKGTTKHGWMEHPHNALTVRRRRTK